MAVGHKTGGRKKGTPNKLTGDLRAMILGALDDAGGREYLLTQASANPTAFMALIGRVLPLQVAGDPKNPIRVEMTIEQRRAEALRAIDEAFREPVIEHNPAEITWVKGDAE